MAIISAVPKPISIDELISLSNKYDYSLVTLYPSQIDKWDNGTYGDWIGKEKVSILCGKVIRFATNISLNLIEFEGFFIPPLTIPFEVHKCEIISLKSNEAKLIISSKNGCFAEVVFQQERKEFQPLNGRFVMNTLHDPENIYTNPYYRDELLSFEDSEKFVSVLNVHRMNRCSMPWIGVDIKNLFYRMPYQNFTSPRTICYINYKDGRTNEIGMYGLQEKEVLCSYNIGWVFFDEVWDKFSKEVVDKTQR